jgi:hypothetical protein
MRQPKLSSKGVHLLTIEVAPDDLIVPGCDTIIFRGHCEFQMFVAPEGATVLKVRRVSYQTTWF